MPLLEEITLAQLRGYTKAQIINYVTKKLNGMTRRKLIMLLWDEIQEIPREPVRAYRKDEQIESQIEIQEDAETGEQTGKRALNWTYYPTGEVDEITISEFDASNALLKRKVIKHYTDGKQPTVKEA